MSDTVQEARDALERDICPECGHAADSHGENHDDGCNATGACSCGLNARDCYASINKSAAIDALIAAVRAEERARCIAVVMGMRHDTVQPNMGAVVVSGAHESYQVRVMALSAVLAALTGSDK